MRSPPRRAPASLSLGRSRSGRATGLPPGQADAGEAALTAAKLLSESLGHSATLWNLMLAGTNSGLRAITRGYDSMAASQEFLEKAQVRLGGAGGPLPNAVRAGSLTLTNQVLSVLVEV